MVERKGATAMDGGSYPFQDMQSDGHRYDVMEFINIDNPDEDAKDAARKEHLLDLLDLGAYSTADDVRRRAISFRRQAQEKGVNTETLNALKWVLGKTNDCLDDSEFSLFLLNDFGFDEISAFRTLQKS